MSVVRNLVVITSTAATAAILAAGMFGFLAPPLPPTPPVVDKSNRVPPIPTEPAPIVLGASSGISGTFDPTVPPLAADFATKSVDEWAALIDQERINVGAPLLTYDPALAQVAANLLTDIIANNPLTVTTTPSVVNSKMETPIQQVITQIPGSPATAVAALFFAQDHSSTNDILLQIAHSETITGSITGKQVADSNGWTHYGIAIQVRPGIPAMTNEQVYWVVFFARYVP